MISFALPTAVARVVQRAVAELSLISGWSGEVIFYDGDHDGDDIVGEDIMMTIVMVMMMVVVVMTMIKRTELDRRIKCQILFWTQSFFSSFLILITQNQSQNPQERELRLQVDVLQGTQGAW